MKKEMEAMNDLVNGIVAEAGKLYNPRNVNKASHNAIEIIKASEEIGVNAFDVIKSINYFKDEETSI